MNAPGKGLLKTVSILFIIFGAIATIVSIAGLVGSAALAAAGGELGAAIGGIMIVAVIFALLMSVLELVIGIIGVKKAGDPAQAKFFITTGIILCVIALISLIMGIVNGGFQVTSLIGFVLPILYVVGGNQNKKAAQ